MRRKAKALQQVAVGTWDLVLAGNYLAVTKILACCMFALFKNSFD